MTDGFRFPLCRQTVTLYHALPAEGRVERAVVHGACLQRQRSTERAAGGDSAHSAFLLVIPQRVAAFGRDYSLAPQDRVLPGQGPELLYSDWPGFVPAAVPGLCVVRTVRPVTVGGRLSHIEAEG